VPTLRRAMASAGTGYRVLIMPEWYPWPDRPGLGIWVREQALALARRNEVAVLASTAGERGGPRQTVSEGMEDGIRVLRVRYDPGRVSQLGFANRLRGTFAALRRLRKEDFEPDVVHAHVFSAGLPAIAVGKRCSAPVIVSEHYSGLPLGLLSRWDRAVARFVFHHATVVCPASAELARHVRAIAPRARVRLAPNPVDTDVFRVPADGERNAGGGVLALNVGALKERKGHEQLLRALALARDQGVELRLEIVGDGPLRRPLEALAQELDVADSVAFLGALAKEDVAARMRAAQFLVLPSLWENAPVVASEAMASGLPVLASRVGGIPEMVGDEAGVLVEPGDVTGLAGGLADMAARWSEYDAGRLAGEARARYGFDAVSAVWESIYAEALR
jgi:glycosyltransferase involved in cell wall biosynthesis